MTPCGRPRFAFSGKARAGLSSLDVKTLPGYFGICVLGMVRICFCVCRINPAGAWCAFVRSLRRHGAMLVLNA